ncbi:MAG TPA: oxygen-independent coproporphyrinogen III oxidase [Limnobacter sp.]|uniref:oxygen-independent coproporphyrinogen III oxidase n=1 Tax=Limnobacter sp. TaxID=2003368 RepID=UPI002EDAF517
MSADILPFNPGLYPNPAAVKLPIKGDLSALLTQFDRPGPRYTSYPTIDQCVESVGAAALTDALKARCVGGLKRPLSLYVHVPFCESVCYYCACNKVVTKKHDRATQYLSRLEKEALMVARIAPTGLSPVTQFHMGGGTPTFLSDSELLGLVEGLKRIFRFSAKAEMSIEVDPRTVNENRLLHLRSLGFNRISFGVQDFDPDVQKAVHREQTFESVQVLLKAARRLGFESINVDLIHGLPKQTPRSFASTLDQLIDLVPDRVALYGYAHLPSRFKPQRRIHDADLPDAATRVALLRMAIERMQTAGYEHIGMDHFAKPQDPLAVAKRQGRLHRNFQGYTTQPEADLIGLGVSAISKVGNVLVQNVRELPEYEDRISRGELAVFRGHEGTREDNLRHAAIMALLCQGEIHFGDFSEAFWLDFQTHFDHELAQLVPFVKAGLIERLPDGLRVTDTGWLFVRPMAMCFDAYIGKTQIQRSKLL